MKMRKNKINIETEEERAKVLSIFQSLESKNQIHQYFNISDNKNGSLYIKEIAEKIGFDLSSYKEKKKKFCLNCGKQLKKGQTKFCSRNCSATYNNSNRQLTEKTKNKISVALKKNIVENIKEKKVVSKPSEKYCLYCGKLLTKNNKFCNNDCSSKYFTKERLEKWLCGELVINPNNTIPDFIRNYLLRKTEYSCEECGFSGYNKKTGKSILQIHHIDGDSSNNKEENLQVLCPKCHAMTENYMGLNKGNSARDKRYKKGE